MKEIKEKHFSRYVGRPIDFLFVRCYLLLDRHFDVFFL